MGTVVDSTGMDKPTRAAFGSKYTLQVRQQPERARLCSYKEENETIDRRPVDPPPVVELRSTDVPYEHLLDSTSFFIRASIVSASSFPVLVPDHGLPSISEPYYSAIKTPIGADATTGEVVQTPEKLRLLDGRPAALCVFAKLSVRVPGVFRLMFTLYDTTESGIVEITRTVSEPFEVFSPKLFKGMHESTQLTRHLAAQGLKIKLRTDTSVGRQSTSRRRTPGPSTPTSASGLYEKPSSSSVTRTSQPLSSSSSSSVTLVGGPLAPATAAVTATATSSGSSGSSRYPHPPFETKPLGAPMPPAKPRVSSAPSTRSLVWRQNMEPFGYANDQAMASAGPSTTIGKRRFVDDGSLPSLKELSSRFDWTPTPPATDLAAFSLSRHGSPSFLPSNHPYHRSNRTDSPYATSPSNRGSESSVHTMSSSSTHHSSSFSGPLSAQTRTSSNITTTSSVSSPLPSPFPRLNLGPGDDGIPILPPPSMYASSAAPRSHAGSSTRSIPPPPSFVPPSVDQVLEPTAGSSSSSSSIIPQHHSNPPSVIYSDPRMALPSPRLKSVAGNAPPYAFASGSDLDQASTSSHDPYHLSHYPSVRPPVVPLTLPPIRPLSLSHHQVLEHDRDRGQLG